MTNCIFVSDLHGHQDRYIKLFKLIESDRPQIVFLGGDIMPGISWVRSGEFGGKDFVRGFIAPHLKDLRDKLADKYPKIFLILGNDDGKRIESAVLDIAGEGLWEYIHGRKVCVGEFTVYGYAYVPPTPFRLKDWERYDVSRYVDPGSVSPEEGTHTVPSSTDELRYSTILMDLEALAGEDDLSKSIFLFHSPPYKTSLDRAALDGIMIDHVPLDVHVGSIAIRRFIENRQPLLTLHGHIHESARLTGAWKDEIGRTVMFNASHNGYELAAIRFDPAATENAVRELI